MSNFAYSNLRFEYGLWLDSLCERPSECHQHFHAAVQAGLPWVCRQVMSCADNSFRSCSVPRAHRRQRRKVAPSNARRPQALLDTRCLKPPAANWQRVKSANGTAQSRKARSHMVCRAGGSGSTSLKHGLASTCWKHVPVFFPPPPPGFPPPPLDSGEHAADRHARGSMKVRASPPSTQRVATEPSNNP